MSQASTSFVIGYHGWSKEIGMKAVLGECALVAQDRAYHWLGSGIYVEHGFAFPGRGAYDRDAAERHWERLFALPRRAVGPVA